MVKGSHAILTHRRWLVSAVVVIGLHGCAGIPPGEPVTTVESVDLARYVGTWYEIARLPMWFQRHCVDSKAVYTRRDDGRIGVHNECVTDSGEVSQADGTATVVDPVTNARLSVTFDNWFSRLFGSSSEGNYWILALDSDYQTAMVGTPDRRYLWMLARSPHIAEATYQDLAARAQRMGFPVSELIRDQRAPR